MSDQRGKRAGDRSGDHKVELQGNREELGRRGSNGMARLGDLLPDAARQLGLEDELDLATAMTAWQSIVAERIPAAVGACRIVALSAGVATVETDEPIVAQEVRLRTPELLAALRSALRSPVRQLRVTARHV